MESSIFNMPKIHFRNFSFNFDEKNNIEFINLRCGKNLLRRIRQKGKTENFPWKLNISTYMCPKDAVFSANKNYK